ncbi:hypothetical protein BOX15_Mlig012441g1, partial [Macrostomum lignano]
ARSCPAAAMSPAGASAFSMRIVSLETAMEQPVSGLDVTYSDFRSGQCSRVPVLRVFGSTPAGRKCCTHVHGVFPYFYVPFEGCSGPRADFLKAFAASLDKAINIAVRRSSSSTVMHVFCINVVLGRSFYGFHANESEFMKIHMFNPKMVKKAADLLLGGSVMNKICQPFESHIPFGLQFLMDFNLYGMNFLHASVARRRGCLGSDAEEEANEEPEAEGCPGQAADPSPAPPATHCRVEVDISAVDILNRLEVDDNLGSNPGLTALWEEEIERRQELLGETPPSPPSSASTSTAGAARAWVAAPDSPDREGVEPTESEDKWRRRFRRFLQERGLINATGFEDEAPAEETAEGAQVADVKSGLGELADAPSHAEVAEFDAEVVSFTEEDVDDFLNGSANSVDTEPVVDHSTESAESPGSPVPPADQDEAPKQPPPPLVSRASIDRVVACSQSFLADSSDSSDGSDRDAADADSADSEATCEELASRMLDEFLVRSPSSSQEVGGAAAAAEDPAQVEAELNDSQRDLFAVEDYEDDNEDEEQQDEHRDEAEEAAGQLDAATLLQFVRLEEQDSVLAVAFDGGSDSDDEDDEDEEAGDEAGISGPPQLDGALSSSDDSSSAGGGDDDGDFDESPCRSSARQRQGRAPQPPPPPPARRGRRLGLSMASRPAAGSAAAASSMSSKSPPGPTVSSKAFKPVAFRVGSGSGLSGRPMLLGKRRSVAPPSPPSPPSQPPPSSPPPLPPQPATTQSPSSASSLIFSQSLELASFTTSGQRLPTSTQQHQQRLESSRSNQASSNTQHLLGPNSPEPPSTLPKRQPAMAHVYAPLVAPPTASEVADSLDSFGLFPCRNPPLRPDAAGVDDLRQFDSLAVGVAGLASFDRASALAAASVSMSTSTAPLLRYRPLIDPPSRDLVARSLKAAAASAADKLAKPAAESATAAAEATVDDAFDTVSNSSSHRAYPRPAAAIGGIGRKELLARIKAKVRRSLSETSAMSSSSTSMSTSAAAATTAAVVGDGLTLASLEVATAARPGLLPDPRHDAIVAAFLTVADASEANPTAWRQHCLFVAATDAEADRRIRGFASAATRFQAVRDEAALLEALADTVRCADPDIVLGFDTQRASWGYLIDRAKQLQGPPESGGGGLPMAQLLSRYRLLPHQQQHRRRREPEANCSSQSQQPEDGLAGSYEAQSDSLRIGGRVVINLWRLLRYELSKLRSNSFEACAALVLNRRYPCYSSDVLWRMWQDGRDSWRVVEHLETRSCGSLRMLSTLGLVSRTAEFARVFGIEFYHVLSRGSQYRVESMMLRLAKPLGLLPLSPSVQQRARQAAPDAIPLTLEPRSGLHTDPVVVLDFQSLYPSIMIAYNYCFSTCIGRAASITTCDPMAYEFGCHRLMTDPGAYQRAAGHLNFSPLGIGFVDASVQRGVISRMVEEILATRLMVKAAMKRYGGNEPLLKLLDARQLGLKLIANVTYGYTAASFSGRMPCVEVGDSIVRKARETLERAIALVQAEPSWRAQVIYGDTDSLFVLLPGRSRREAFEIGQAMARAVTAVNPKPVKLRFEKVYQPCLLLTKKHYAGFMYETADQLEPTFDAKGIETVRRDSCPAAGRILGRSLRELLSSLDLSRVRRVVEFELHRLHWGRSPLQELIIAREHRGCRNYSERAAVPGLAVVRRRLAADPRAEPPLGYRVQFVVVRPSQPGQGLCARARSPRSFWVLPVAGPADPSASTGTIMPANRFCRRSTAPCRCSASTSSRGTPAWRSPAPWRASESAAAP